MLRKRLHVTLHTSDHGPDDECWYDPFALWVYGNGLTSFLYELHAWIHPFQAWMCVMDCLIFPNNWLSSQHTQLHITMHTSAHGPDDECWYDPFVLWVYNSGLKSFLYLYELHAWIHPFHAWMCVMDCLISPNNWLSS